MLIYLKSLNVPWIKGHKHGGCLKSEENQSLRNFQKSSGGKGFVFSSVKSGCCHSSFGEIWARSSNDWLNHVITYPAIHFHSICVLQDFVYVYLIHFINVLIISIWRNLPPPIPKNGKICPL